MRNWEINELTAVFHEELQIVNQMVDKTTASQLNAIIWNNLKKGRVHLFLEGNRDLQPHDYTWLVVDTYQHLHAYLYQIQVIKSEEVLLPLHQKMHLWAYNYLLCCQFPAGSETCRLALQCAESSSRAIVNAYFPYDVNFDPWTVILLRKICKGIVNDGSKRPHT